MNKNYKCILIKLNQYLSQHFYKNIQYRDFLINNSSENNSIYIFHTLDYNASKHVFIYLALSASMAITTSI